MDFFAAQAAARRRTVVLVVWFALAFTGTIALVFAGVSAVLAASRTTTQFELAFSGQLLSIVTAGVTAVTLGGFSWHRSQLAKDGGAAVARLLGGMPVDRRTEDAAEKRFVNVTEEMAIAAGLPVPALYVLPSEAGINAFAAGYSTDDAVVAVTRGSLDALTRDELQGVVAHELSHVLNGDARLNLQLVALIGGITVLALVGRLLVRFLWDGRPRTRSRSRGGGVEVGLFSLGVCVWLAGSVGAFFARIIRAAVSRQREFLADAAAVQFTRNPEGLAGALAKVAGAGSAISSAAAPEASHLFFANGLRSRWLATHPPIEDRIRRLVPQGLARAAARAVVAGAPVAQRAGSAQAPLTAAGLIASVGRPGPEHVAHAARVLVSLPPEVAAAARDPATAAALVRALLVDANAAVRAVQLGALVDPALRAEVERLAVALGLVRRADRMAVLDLALGALDALPRDAAAALTADLRGLAEADGRTTVLEWAVLRIVGRRLARRLGGAPAPVLRARTLEDVQVDALDLLSALAWAGARDEAGAQAALESALGVLGVRGWRVLPRDRIGAKRLEVALARLEGATPPLKARVIEACAACVLADGQILPTEGEMIRAVAASLGVPVPPLVSGAEADLAGAGAV